MTNQSSSAVIQHRNTRTQRAASRMKILNSGADATLHRHTHPLKHNGALPLSVWLNAEIYCQIGTDRSHLTIRMSSWKTNSGLPTQHRTSHQSDAVQHRARGWRDPSSRLGVQHSPSLPVAVGALKPLAWYNDPKAGMFGPEEWWRCCCCCLKPQSGPASDNLNTLRMCLGSRRAAAAPRQPRCVDQGAGQSRPSR
jgi:hypothetical protein